MIETICVCGAGTMGRGIAQLMAGFGYSTVLFDVDPGSIGAASVAIEQALELLVQKKKISADDKAATLAHLRFTNDLNDCIADLVIEAIVESLPEKMALLNQLAEVNHAETIFATNTSSLSVSNIANGVQHPSRVAGLHFFNPPVTMKLVELVTTDLTDPVVTANLTALCRSIGKTVVNCKDAPGFIVNRVARPFYLESLHLAEHHNINFEEIDRLLEATGFRMGPFRLMDLIGNDINYAVSMALYEALGKPARLKPSVWQQQKVTDKQLGRKTGKGYYNYDAPPTSMD